MSAISLMYDGKISCIITYTRPPWKSQIIGISKGVIYCPIFLVLSFENACGTLKLRD